MTKKNKFYVVWRGVIPGIYTSWKECETQIKGFEGALYKSFDTKELADIAYESSPNKYISSKKKNSIDNEELIIYPEDVIENSISVDAACSGNPGMMEYRGVYTATGQELFKFGPIWGTNNIGEFLAIVHALAYIKQNDWDIPIYTDSINALKWIDSKKCGTKLAIDEKSLEIHEMIVRAQYWLQNNTYATKIFKWNTLEWGEIPADFGRK